MYIHKTLIIYSGEITQVTQVTKIIQLILDMLEDVLINKAI